MIKALHQSWLKNVASKHDFISVSLLQRQNISLKILQCIFSENCDIHYLLPEIIDFVERNQVDQQKFLELLFSFRDQLVLQEKEFGLPNNSFSLALQKLQDIIIKIGSYFSHLRMDLNITKQKVSYPKYDRIEGHILKLDHEFRIEKTNSSLLTFFGYEKDEIIGKHLLNLFSTSSRTIIQNSLKQLQNNLRLRIELEVEAQNKNNQRFQAVLKVSRINIEEESAQYTAYIQDNSYIQETQSTLNLLSLAMDSVSDGIIMIDPDAGGTLLFINDTIERMSGFSRKHLLGQPLGVFRGKKANEAEDQEVIDSSVKKGWKGEKHFVRKNGTEYLVSLDTRPVIDEYGKPIAIVAIVRDITDNKARENKILQLQKLVGSIINNLPHFLIVTDDNFKIKFWNYSLEKESGIDSAAATGRNIFDVLPRLKNYNLDIAAKEALIKDEMFSRKFLFEFKDGSENYYQLFLNTISVDSEKQLLWTLQDVTKEELLKIKITWQNARLKFLEKFSQLLNSNLDINSIFRKSAHELRELLHYSYLSFLLPTNPENFSFNLFFVSKESEDYFPQNVFLNLSEQEPYRKVVESRIPVILNKLNSEADSTSAMYLDELEKDCHKIIHIPVVYEKEILGIMNIGHTGRDAYPQSDIDFLQQITSHLAVALKNSSYFKLIGLQNKKLNIINNIYRATQSPDGMQELYESTLEGIAGLINSKSVAFYQTISESSWKRIITSSADDIFPETLELPLRHLKEQTYIWNESTPSTLKMNLSSSKRRSRSGGFSWRVSSALENFSLMWLNSTLVDQVKPDIIQSIIEEIIKQMIIGIDHIYLFQKVRQAESEWETTFNTVNIGLVIVDRRFRIRRVNKAMKDMYQNSVPDFLGKTCKDTFCLDPDPESCFHRHSPKVEIKIINSEYYDEKIQKSILKTFYPMFDPSHKFIGGIFSLYDISEIKSQEEKIKFLSKFPETNPNLVLSITADDQITYFNPAVSRLIEELNISKSDVRKILPDEYLSILKDENKERKFPIELNHQFMDKVFEYYIHKPLEDSNYYFYGIEITEKEALHKQLLQTERIRAVGEMAAGVAHDFNNLLATILGRSQLLLLKLENNSLSEELKIIEKAAKEGGQIVRRLQEVTKDKQSKNFVALNIIEMIKESLIFSANKLKVNNQLRGKPVQLHTDFEGIPIVKGDPVEFREIFTNLLLNAYDAMPNGGDLYISCKEVTGHEVEIIIRDTGTGMPEEVQSKIFNPFFTTKGDKGTGLGLSIAYKTVTAFGGNIKVESEINKGSRFMLSFPACMEEIPAKSQTQAQAQDSIEKIRLLIVDDEPELLDTMAEILRLKFKTVEIANSGSVALEKVQEQEFDVILTDLGMPEMSGWELAEKIKDILPHSRIILVTGWGNQARDELKHHPSVDDVLAKPYELQELIKKINLLYKN